MNKSETNSPPTNKTKTVVVSDLVSTADMNSMMDVLCAEHYSIGKIIYSIFHILMTALAIILSFRCNNKSIDAGSLIIAIFFPYIYIIWVFATKDLRAQCDI